MILKIDIEKFLTFIKEREDALGISAHSIIKKYFDDIVKSKKEQSVELKRLYKEKLKGVIMKKPCPECGCDMVRTHEIRDKNKRICGYRRWSCTYCTHYESHSSQIKFETERNTEFSLAEIDKKEGEKANRYFPKNGKLLRKQSLNLNNKDL